MTFDKSFYIEEMMKMVDIAIQRLLLEKPNYKIYSTNIWTDPNAAMSSINFDSKESSLNKVKESNDWNKKYYDQYLEEGDFEQAELFKPNVLTRVCNPTDFELKDFEEINNRSFPENWENETDGECWKQLEPALIEIGNYAFTKSKALNLEDGFELSINSDKDWYDKTWQ